MKHQLPMFCFKPAHQLHSGGRRYHLFRNIPDHNSVTASAVAFWLSSRRGSAVALAVAIEIAQGFSPAPVAVLRKGPLTLLKEPQSTRAIAHKLILRLLIMLQHHLVVLSPNARLLIPAKRRMCRIKVIAVRPHSSRLNRSPKVIRAIQIPR